MSSQNAANRIANLDLSLFAAIESQTTDDDRKSLLAIQNALRNIKRSYVYLEIGSYLGGSLQPYLLDPKCVKIYSIDKRPLLPADERYPEGYHGYPGNSMEGMLDNLKRVSDDTAKITCFDCDAAEVYTANIDPKPDVCFIDGEHTNRKVISDFEACKRFIGPNGLFVFHDCQIVSPGINTLIANLKKNREKFKAYSLPDTIFVISFNEPVDREEKITLYRRRMHKLNIIRWFLWSLLPNVRIRKKIKRLLGKD